MVKDRINGNRWQRLLLISVAAVLLLAACAAGDSSANSHEFRTLTGETQSIAYYEGKVVVVNFWATWCPPCRLEMPEFQRYYDAHQGDDYVFFAVNAGETAALAQQFIGDFGYTFPIGLDPYGEFADKLGGVSGMPTTFVFDKNGELAYKHVGILDISVLEEHVTPLLAQ